MQIIRTIIQSLIYGSVLITAIVTYLNINKVWSRKHDPTVAESISVGCNSLFVASALPLVISSLIKNDLSNAANFLVMTINDGVFLLIGIGLWVREGRRITIWQKFLRSLRQERNEVGNLVKDMGKPTGEEQLLAILRYCQLNPEVE